MFFDIPIRRLISLSHLPSCDITLAK